MPVGCAAIDIADTDRVATTLFEIQFDGGMKSASFRISVVRTAETEPSIKDLLSEPIIQAVMRADGVTEERIVSVLARARPARVQRSSPDGRL